MSVRVGHAPGRRSASRRVDSADRAHAARGWLGRGGLLPALLLTMLVPHAMAHAMERGQGGDGDAIPAAETRDGEPQGQAPPDADRIIPATGQTLPDPVFRVDAHIRGQRVYSWTEQPGRVYMLLVEGDASLDVGLYRFRARRMAIRIETDPEQPRRVYHLAAYLEEARTRPREGNDRTTVESPNLLVTGAIEGAIRMRADVVEREAAEDDSLVVAARQRIARHREARARRLLDVDDAPLFGPEVEQRRQQRRQTIARRAIRQAFVDPDPPDPPDPPEPRDPVPPPDQPEPPEPPDDPPDPEQPALPDPPEERPPFRVLPDEGQVTLSARRVSIDAQRGAVVLAGEVAVVYHGAPGRRPRALQADRAVVFFDRDRTGGGRTLDADAVTGVYLEDNVVATSGDFTLRAPRVYYDTRSDQAVVLDAVLFTYDMERQVPLYVRARELRQHSLQSWEARDARLTTSSFAEPHLAIGASRAEIEQRVDEDRTRRTRYATRDITLRADGVPFFYWPWLGGEIGDSPLDSVSVGYRSHVGPMIETRWDAFALAGRTSPDGVTGLLKLDYLGRHGPGIGARLDYDRPQMRGTFDSIFLPYDTGRDEIGDREPVRFDGDQRGFARLEHRHYVPDENLTADLEVSYLSDPTFLEEFDRARADVDRPWRTRIFLKHGEEDWAATLSAQHDLNNFIPQTTTLQAPGYTVEKTGELGYRQVGISIWEDRLTYYGESRLSWMRLRGGRDRPADRGITGADSLALFGIADDARFETRLTDQGLDDDRRLRLDTRHELSAPMNAGDVRITPYIVGRFTGYDADFEDFRGESDQVRLYGQAGTRASMQLHRAYPDAELPLLDVSGIRHIMEPHINVFVSGANLDSRDLPEFDMDVEGLSEGVTSRIGLRQTLQTQRGGPGQWRNVNWLVLDTDLILRTSEAETDHTLARYFSSRPEMTVGGDHIHSRLAWQVTDTSALSGEMVYGLDAGRFDYWRAGWALRSSAPLDAYVDYAEIGALDSQRLSYGVGYQISDKYAFGARHQHDFGQQRARLLTVNVSRRLPQGWLNFVGGFDDIDDDVFFGVSFTPEFGGRDPGAGLPFDIQ